MNVVDTNAGIRGQCIIYSVSISMYSDRKTDSVAGTKLSDEANANKNSVSVSKSFFKNESSLKAIRNMAVEAKAYLYEHSLPWGDGGQRLVRKEHWADIEKNMDEYKSKFNDLVINFLSDYDAMKDRSILTLGTLWTEEEFPTLEYLNKAFNWDSSGATVPDVNDYRVGMSVEQETRFKQLIENNMKQKTDQAISSNLNKIRAVVGRYRERMGAYGVDENNKVIGKFKDETVNQLRDLSQFVEAYNVTNNQELNDIVTELNDLVQISPDALRESPSLRERAHKSASDILHRVEGVENGLTNL